MEIDSRGAMFCWSGYLFQRLAQWFDNPSIIRVAQAENDCIDSSIGECLCLLRARTRWLSSRQSYLPTALDLVGVAPNRVAVPQKDASLVLKLFRRCKRQIAVVS